MRTSKRVVPKEPADRLFILDKTARLFREQGFERTTVKQVAEACDMLPGSLHYRYNTKEALLVDLMKLAIQQISSAVLQACSSSQDPSEQLRASINAHLRVLVTDSDMVYVLLFEWRSLKGEARKDMLALRDQYEQLWASLITVLVDQGVIRKDLDANLLRLIGLGALNWVATWFKKDGEHSLEDIGDFVWSFLTSGLVISPTKKVSAKKSPTKKVSAKKSPAKKNKA